MTVESRSVKVVLSMDAAGYIATAQKAGKATDDAMSKAKKAAAEASKAQDELAGTAGKVGLAAAVALGAVVSTTANFGQAMSKVQAATRETASGLDSLRDAALEAGAETAFSATEAAAGIENLAKAGLSTKDILDGGLTGALDLAAAGEMQVADAAEAAAGALAQFNLEGDQAVHVADLLAAGAGKAQGDVSDMVLALKQAGTVSAQTGLSLEETVGSLAAMAEQSLLGSDAGTSFKTMLASLTPNSEAAANAMERYNIHAFDAQGNFVGMTALAGQLRSGLKDLTDEQRAMALETIFGSDAVRAAAIIYDNGADGIAKWISQVDDSGFAAETAKTKLDNLKGDLEELGGAFETALIGTGDGSQGVLRSLTQGATDLINAYNDLPPSAQGAATAVLASAAGIGGSIWVGSKLVQGISNTREAFDNLEASGSRAGKMVKGLTTASAAAVGILVLAGAVVELANSMDESLPGLETLQGRLIDFATLGSQGFSVSLGKEFDSIGESIDRVADPTRWQRINDGFGSFNDLVLPGDARDRGLREATAEIEALDAALAQLVASGSAETAELALTNLAQQYGLSEGQVASLKGELTLYDEALAGAANEAKLAAAAEAKVTDASQGMGAAMGRSTQLTKKQAEALKEAKEAAGETARDFLAYGDSLDDAKVSLGEWLREQEKSAEALENFTANAKKAAKNGLDDGLIASLEAAGPAGALRMKQLANATEEEIERANKAWRRGQKAIDDYVDATTKVPGEKSTNLNLKAMKAIADLIAFRNRLDEATKDRIFTITTQYRTVRSASDALPDRTPRKASGGQVFGPGTTTSDDIPAWLSNKEYVIRAAAVDHYGVGFFDDANAMRLAAGGSADRRKRRRTRAEFDSVVDYSPSEAALAQAAEAAEMYYEEQERAQRKAEQRAEAVLDGQQRAWDMATDAAKAQVDAAQQMVASVEANMDRLGQAATAQFQSQVFSRNQQRGLWVGGAGSGWRGALEGDVAGLRERSSIITELSRPGMNLSPEALETLLREADNAQIRDMLAAGEVDDYAALFAERARLTGEVQGQAGMAGYGQEYAAVSAQLVGANGYLEQILAAISAARPINVTETISAEATAREVARLQAAAGGY
jgi:TP901 family phage tail tape measure protein